MGLRTEEPIHQSQKVQNVHKNNYSKKVIEHLNNSFAKLTGKSLKNERLMTHIDIFLTQFISVYDNFSQK